MTQLDTTSAVPFDKPPRWAQLMRELFSRMPSAVESICERYLAPDGTFLWPHPDKVGTGLIDGLDDAYESFHTWPLAYLLGADESLLTRGENGFDAVTRQFAHIPTGHGHPMVVSEYEQGYDWFHQGEGYRLFYHLCEANPARAINRERAIRYAGFLLNREVPEPNFDFNTLHFRAPHIGSMGPAFRNFEGRSGVYKALLKYYGLPFQTDRTMSDPLAFLSDEEGAAWYAKEAGQRLGRGDSVTNLASTTMALNAYLMTGDSTYTDWMLDYIHSWMEKAEQNGGIIPDNVGLSGKVGEHTGGDWFGANYGWVWPHGWQSIGKAVTLAMQNALLLTGDQKYPDFLRRHLKHLDGLAIETEGVRNVPHKYGHPGWYNYDTSIVSLQKVLREASGPILWKDGWFEFRPMNPQDPLWLWEMTQNDADWDLFTRLGNHHVRDWEDIAEVPSKDMAGHVAAWAAYLRGNFPDYPERILEHNLAMLEKRLAFLATDSQDPATYGDAYLQSRNPIANEGLIHLTLGTSTPVYNGGLFHSRVRYFDAQKQRPGLPADVAALVERMDNRTVDLCLINLHETQTRRLVIRAGFYGEHRFVGAKSLAGDEFLMPVNGSEAGASDLDCTLPPRSSLRIALEMERFVHPPHTCFPAWPAD